MRYTDSNGNARFSTYDDRGNETVQAVVGIFTNRFAYDANNNLLTTVNGRGCATNYTYDASGNVTSVTDALSHRTTAAYNSLNKLTVVTNTLGQRLQMLYDAKGNLLERINNLGFRAAVTRDSQGRITSLTDAAGNTRMFDYSGGCDCGQPGKIINPDGSFRLLEYDSLGRTTRELNELGAETLYELDSAGRTNSARDPLMNTIKYFYNGSLLTQVVDALNRTNRYEYDVLNRTNKIINAEGGVVEFRYDANGNRTHVIDLVGNITLFVYDQANRLIREIDPLGSTNSFTYDAAGNRLESIDRNGRRRTFAYDTLNGMTNEVWWEGANVVRSIAFAFNEVDRLVLAADPAARYTYDALNGLSRVAQSAVPGQPDFSLTYTYTALGKIESVIDNYGVRVDSGYDQRGRLARRTWQGPGVDPARVDVAYDLAGNRTRTDRYADLAGTEPTSSARPPMPTTTPVSSQTSRILGRSVRCWLVTATTTTPLTRFSSGRSTTIFRRSLTIASDNLPILLTRRFRTRAIVTTPTATAPAINPPATTG